MMNTVLKLIYLQWLGYNRLCIVGRQDSKQETIGSLLIEAGLCVVTK